MFVYGTIILTRAITGSDGFTGLVFLMSYLPALLFGPVAGALLDRVSRLAVVQLAQSVYMITAFVLAVVIHFTGLSDELRWIILGIGFLNGTALTFLIPGRLSLLANLVPEGDAGRATVILNVLIIIGFGAAPLIAGFIKAALPWSGLFYATGALYASAWVLMFFVHPRPYERRVSSNAFADFREGLSFAVRTPLIREVLLLEMIVMGVIGPLLVLMPQYAQAVLGLSESERGAFLSSMGAGLFVGGIIARTLHNRGRRGWMMLGGALIMGLVLSQIVRDTSVTYTAIILAVCGTFGGAVGAMIPAALQGAAPDYLRGRVMSLYGMIFQVFPGVGGFASGLLADQVGTGRAVAYMGLGICVCTILAILGLRHVRSYD